MCFDCDARYDWEMVEGSAVLLVRLQSTRSDRSREARAEQMRGIWFASSRNERGDDRRRICRLKGCTSSKILVLREVTRKHERPMKAEHGRCNQKAENLTKRADRQSRLFGVV
jgi:hypothetical protein